MMGKIKTGLCSFGMSGMVFHAPFIDLHEGFELHSIVERSKNLAKPIYKDVNVVRSVDELLSIDDIELVVVNTPDTTHYDYTKRALQAGKHVVVEKPFVFTVAEGEELIELARQRGVMLSVYQNRRWDNDFLTVKKILAEGLVGRVVEFHSAFQRYRNFIQPGTWKEKSDRRVGITYNLGSHKIDQALQLFGQPESVMADIDILREGGEVDDYYFIQLIYPHLKISLKAGYLMREETPSIYVHGALGSYVKYGSDPQEDLLKVGKKPEGADWGSEPEQCWGILNTEGDNGHTRAQYPSERGDYMAFYNDIHKALTTGCEPLTAAHRVLPVIRIIECCFESSEQKRAIKI